MSVAIQQNLNSHDSPGFLHDTCDALTCLEHSLKLAKRPVASTKFSPDSAVFLHMLTQVSPDIPIIWVDTGFNTRDTLRFAAHLTSMLDLNLKTYHPADPHAVAIPEIGTPEHDEFTFTMKLEPFEQALNELRPDLWLSSLRRFQSVHRSNLTARERINAGLVKCYPMLEWSTNTTDLYRRRYALPLGPEVYDPTKGLPLRECGLHTKQWSAVDSLPSPSA